MSHRSIFFVALVALIALGAGIVAVSTLLDQQAQRLREGRAMLA